MREVLLAANAEHTTQRQYDAARTRVGVTPTPRAQRLAQRFGVSWPTLARIAVLEQDPTRAAARVGKRQMRAVLTRAESTTALQTAARRLDTSELSPASYERTRLAINGEIAARHLHGRAVKPLPSVDVLRERFVFGELLVAAGLTLAAPGAKPLLSRSAAIVLFVEHCGFLPRQQDLRWFASHHQIQLVDREHERHSVATSSASSEFQASGRWFPPQTPERLPHDWQALAMGDSACLAQARQSYPAARKSGYSLGELRDGIRRAFDLLQPGQTLTQERYRTLSVTHGLPSPSVIQRKTKRLQTSFGVLVREVATERATAMQPLPTRFRA